MSLSITINNINDLTDTEREVLRLVVGDVRTTGVLVHAAGPSITKQYIESLVHKDGDPNNNSLDNLDVVRNAPAVPIPPFRPHENICAAVAVPIPASAELDANGLPWDKRIHSSSRAKVADGTWRMMRGVDEALVATVEDELRAVQAIPVPVLLNHGGVDAVPIPVAVTTEGGAPVVTAAVPVPAPVVGAAEQAVINGANPVAAVPAPPAPIATVAEMQAKLDAAVGTPLTFADLMKHVTPMLVSGKLPQDTLLAVTAEFGLPHLAALGARPDLVEAVRARIDEVCNGAA